MIIDKKDFKKAKNELLDALGYGATCVMVPNHPTELKNLVFCAGGFDVAEFYHHHPYDGDRYNAYGISSLYETMALIDKGKMNAIPFMDEQGRINSKMIDIGKSVTERNLIESVHLRMPGTDWYYAWSDDRDVRERGAKQVSQMQEDLKRLSHTSIGMEGVRAIWQLYAKGVPVPSFIDEGMKEAAAIERTVQSLQNQYTLAGFQEFYSPAIRELVKAGVPEITHRYEKRIDGDEVRGELQIIRSKETGDYALHKFSMGLVKQNDDYQFNRSFFLYANQLDKDNARQDIGPEYSLRKAYNLLSGRPIHIGTYAGSQGNRYDKWEKISYKKILVDGSYGIDETKAKGFSLSAVIKKFPFREAQNKKHLTRLIRILKDGGLAKATLVNQEGRERNVFVSVNLHYQSLHLYNEYRVPVALKELIQDKFMGYEAVNRLERQLPAEQKTRLQIQDTSTIPNLTKAVTRSNKWMY